MVYDKRISLDPRLSKIAEMLGTCKCCADIGSDHGRLGAFLIQNGQCERMCLTDISAASLEKARKLIRLLALENQTAFYVGDGARALEEKVDAAVIAGMGGETIAEILEASGGKLDGARLLLQPNVAAPYLRRRLNAFGWRITDEALVRDGRRIYVIIGVEPGEQRLSDAEYEVGPVLLKNHPEPIGDYARFRLRVAGKALEGALNGADETVVEGLRTEIKIWKGVEECL